AAEVGVGLTDASPDPHVADSRGRVGIAGRVVVRAGLLDARRPIATDRHLGRIDLHRPLPGAVLGSWATARDAEVGHELGAHRRARAPRGPVRRTVVTLLAALDDTVAARLDLALRRAAVAGSGVAVL